MFDLMIIATKSATLANELDSSLSYDECLKEYIEQLIDNTYNSFLRVWIGWLVENKNQRAIDIMKLIIRNNIKQ